MFTFVLKRKWFNKFASGEKEIEYRENKPYWEKRLFKAVYFQVSSVFNPALDH